MREGPGSPRGGRLGYPAFMLQGLHFLLTYRCTHRCDHCFLRCGPEARGTFTLEQVRRALDQGVLLGTVERVYFEGGEPFLYAPLLVEGIRLARGQGLEVGVVTGAQGQVALDVEIHGEAGHSGTVPMPLRHDAMACATEATQACRHLVLQEGRGVFTVGFFTMEPNSRTTIPNQVRLGIDLRHPDSSSLDQLKAELTCTLQEIAQTHGCQLEVRVLFQKEPVVFDTRCIQAVQIATDQLQYSSRTMASGAFHDACLVATIAPTGMIFVPSQHGISHNPTEYSSPEQLERGGNVLLHALLQLAESIPNTS